MIVRVKLDYCKTRIGIADAYEPIAAATESPLFR